MKILISILFTTFVGVMVSAASILPPNNLGLYDDINHINKIDEAKFNAIIDSVIALWAPLAELHHAKLVVEKKWTDPTVNAYAQQRGNIWSVTMFGGLARRDEVTPEGFALVVCHELGHHFGGHYFYTGDSWAAAEGQADYFATQVCGHRVFAKARVHNMRFRQGVPPYVQSRCDAVWKKPAEQELCYTQAAAGLSLANLLAAAGREQPPHFETPDPRKVAKTNVAHPQAQCRLDTYFQGGLCPVPFDLKTIPGKDLGPGANNSPKAEMVASEYSCFAARGFQLGNRPECWFKTQNQKKLGY